MPPVRTSSISSSVSSTKTNGTSNANGVNGASSSSASGSTAATTAAALGAPGASSSSHAGERSPTIENGRPEHTKQQKACIHCRKSKVKCVNDGGPPCRRCAEGNMECKFRLRADDEHWRERTDETLSKLSSTLDALLHRGLPAPTYNPYPGPNAYGPNPPHSAPPYTAQMPPPTLPSPRQGSGTYSPSSSGSVFGQQQQQQPIAFKASPNSDNSGPMEYSSPPHPHSMPRMSSASGSLPNGESSGDHASSLPHRRSISMRSAEMGGHPNLAPSSPASSATSGGPRFSHPAVYSSLPTFSALSLDQNQTSPASILRMVTSDSTPFYLTNPLPMRWTSGITPRESYGAPVAYIGRDDPRLTCISRSIIPLEKVRMLFMFFAEKMQPHSFGFPTFPPTEHMTPLIISAIAMVGSLHEPSCRQYHAALRADIMSAVPQHELSEEQTLDPELGIGVEEITGVCIASAWLGGDDAYRLARTARWWALAYLRQFDLQSSAGPYGRTVTLGEALTILPPFRNIDLPAKLRIWLESYVVDAQQAFIHDRLPLAPTQKPSYFCEALRSSHLGGSISAHAGPRVPQHDRQLIAHASLLEVLLDAQRAERASAVSSTTGWNGEVHGQAQEDMLARRLGDLMSQFEAVDRWRDRICQDEDLSAATPSSMDVTLICFLARAYVGSMALMLPTLSVVTTPGAPEPDHVTSLATLQVHLVNNAKDAALSALELCCDKKGRGFGDRILAMPTWYHFLLSHAVGFLLRLIQKKHRFLLAREAKSILSQIEPFVQMYVFEVTSHAYQAPDLPPANGDSDDGSASGAPSRTCDHPAAAMAQMLAGAISHVKAQSRG